MMYLGGLQELLNAFESRAAHLVQELAQSLDSGRSNGLSAEAAWNDSLVHAFRASKAHSWVLIYRSFSQAVLQSRAELPTATGRILESLLALFGLYWMEEDMGDFLGTGCLSTTQARWVRDQVVQLLHELRNCAVVLVDAWDFSDGQLLDSVLGRKDGLVYEALMREAKLSPLNHEEPGRGVLEYLRPVSSRL
jgi:acyl-CoA oxidase